MPRRVQLWDWPKPEPSELLRRIKRTIRPYPGGVRVIHDRAGDRVQVSLETVVQKLAVDEDRDRWRWIPAVVPAIHYATERYQKPASRGGARTYIAKLPTRDERGTEKDGVPFVAWVDRKGNLLDFASMIKATHSHRSKEGDGLDWVRKRAGEPLDPRPNPSELRWSPEPRQRSRAAKRIRGAAPALMDNPSVPTENKSSKRLLLLVGSLALLGYLSRQREAAA